MDQRAQGDVVEKAAEVVGGDERFGGFIWRCFGRFSGILLEVSTEISQAAC